jgi:hypothetical protein
VLVVGEGWHSIAAPFSLASTACAAAKKTRKSTYDVRTRTERLHVRLDPAEREALDFLADRWDATCSDVVRSMIVGAALAQLDRLDEALDAAEPSFDDVLPLPCLEVK